MQFRLYPTSAIKITRVPGERLSLTVPRSARDMFRLVGEFTHTHLSSPTGQPTKYLSEYGSYRTLPDAVNAYFDIMSSHTTRHKGSIYLSTAAEVDVFITDMRR
jgi:hypothetical protein